METKTLSFERCQIKIEGDAGGFVGYASAFNSVDNVGDTILPGAYAGTLREFGQPKMFVNHDQRALPIGRWQVKEDGFGLLSEAEFTPGMLAAQEARAAVKHQTVDGLSIGFYLHPGDYDTKSDGGRVIKKVHRLAEISIVTFPCDQLARIDAASIKSEIDEVETERDYERFLRDVGGFSTKSAKMLVSRAKVLFSQRDVGDVDEAKTASDLLRAMLSRLPA